MSKKKKRKLPEWDGRVSWEVIKMQTGRHAIFVYDKPILFVTRSLLLSEKDILEKVVEDHEEVQTLLSVMEQCYNAPDSKAARAVMYNALAYHGRIKKELSGGKAKLPHDEKIGRASCRERV